MADARRVDITREDAQRAILHRVMDALDEDLMRALESLEESCCDFRVVPCYRRHDPYGDQVELSLRSTYEWDAYRDCPVSAR